MKPALMGLSGAGLGLLLAGPAAHAQPAFPDCADNYPGGFPPRITDTALAGSAQELCYDGFGVTFSGSAAGPMTSSHYLTRELMRTASPNAGTSVMQMHAEPRLPAALRARSSEFAQAGYETMQLTPASEMADPPRRSETATMANAIPVASGFAQGRWTSVQQIVQDLVARTDVVYVATGSIYPPSSAAAAAGRVTVPQAIFKAVYSPSGGWAGAYVCTNSDHSTCEVTTLASLRNMTGLDVFPALADAIKDAPPPLPPV